MKITLSKKKRGERRHVVLVCTWEEANDIHVIIYNEILNRSVHPHRERLRDGTSRYRFAMHYLDDLMLTFPFAEFSPGLEARLSQQAREQFESMTVPDIEIPGTDIEPRNFQKIGIDKLVNNKRFLLNDEMGLGKTYQLLLSILAAEAFPGLVVVPNSIKFIPWARLIERETDCTVAVLDGAESERKWAIAQDADITIVNTEALRVKIVTEVAICNCDHDPQPHQHQTYNFANPGLFFDDLDKKVYSDIELGDENLEFKWWAVAVADEYHRFKNPVAQQTLGLHLLYAHRKWASSGTPILNGRPEEYWSILHWLWPKRYPSYYEFEKNHCVRKGSKTVAYKGLKELKAWIDEHSLRRRKDQVLDDLPEVVYATHAIDLSPEQRRLYDDILDQLRIWIDEEPRRVATVLAQITRLKQACFSPELYDGSKVSTKVDRVKELVAELVANGEKAIIFSQWSKATRILERELADYNPAYIDGTVPVRDRAEQVDKFNEDETCSVFIGTIGACREGFTLSAGTYVIFTDKGWTPAENMQAAARSASGGMRGEGRGGQHVHIIEILANNTIEDDIEDLLQRKQQMNDRIVESDGGAAVNRISMEDIRSLLFGDD